ncbi:MAG: Rne/Rng family ribonuclease, partial [Bryobacteraceae bacterium]
MTKELVIGSNRHETKVAILEDDKLVEVYFQRTNEYSLAGSIHKGRVTRVLPGMQSAFVDVGLERDAFLYVSDFFEENEDIEPLEDKPARGERRDRQRNPGRAASERNGEPRQPVAASAVTPETETGEIETEGISSAEVTADEAAIVVQSRPEGDRASRDRRGRRSRRRHPHGRGFPESKYAHTPASTVGPVAEHSENSGTGEEPRAETADVMILPGESLAKYRHAAAGATAEEEAEARELDRKAEEIELTDRVFDHHPQDESPEAEEEKFEEVRQDGPASDFAIPDASGSAPPVEVSDEMLGEQAPESAETADGADEAGAAGEEPPPETLPGESPAPTVAEGAEPEQTASV